MPEAEDGLAPDTVEPNFRVQTLGYRQWLDAHHASQGALVALMVHPNDELSEQCHGTLTWTQLAEAIRRVGTASAATSSFVRFLETKYMAKPSTSGLSSTDIVALRTTASWNWAGWINLLDAISHRMSRLLASGPKKIATKVGQIERCWSLQVWPEARGLWLGHTEVTGVGQAKIRPWFLANHDTVDFVISLVSQKLRTVEIPAFRSRMPTVARIEKVTEDGVVELLCYLTPLDQDVLSRTSLEDQAAMLAAMAVTNVVRPMLAAL